MRIGRMKIDRMTNPIGFAHNRPVLSYVVEESTGRTQKDARVQVAMDEAFRDIVFDSGIIESINSIAYPLPLKLQSCSRYYWKVWVTADNGDIAESDTAYFETGRQASEFAGRFIACEKEGLSCDFRKSFLAQKIIKSARAYAGALGLYELHINGEKAGSEYLAPGCNDYDSWMQTQTYDVTDLIRSGKNHITMMGGDGWAIGNFYFEGGADKIYAENQAVLLDLTITYEDGTSEIISTDNSWTVEESRIRFSSMYNGEIFDATFNPDETYNVREIDFDYSKLKPRRSPPIHVQEEIKPAALINTPAGETVLDFGQNMAGWVRFTCREPLGQQITLQYGEILQKGNFYRDNLRLAKAEYTYTSDGKERILRPHFTYYGFRYVKLTGFSGKINPDDFVAEAVYTDMESTGDIVTSNALVNRLIQNSIWSQKSNFFEVPTDCPQRDERLGWTGDAQVFAGTAAYQMDVLAFFSKYGYDLAKEQAKADGCVPFVVPSFHQKGGGSCAWADAATIIPWTMYLHYGDKSILEQQYVSMKSWADYIRKQDQASGSANLWKTGFHFGDWLALDGDDPRSPIGGTETYFIASCYYYYSTLLVSKAAAVLGNDIDAIYYKDRAESIRAAICREYITPTGRLAMNNQTAYVLILALDICQLHDKARVAADLVIRIKKDKEYLKTGFVGTPFICRVLSENGYHELAYKLLLNEECPGWLYPVRMGATTIWERWNSVMPDGSMNPEGMNSLNHYSYGSIVEWIYRSMAGINPVEEAPGFKKAIIRPQPDYRMSKCSCTFKSAAGTYVSNWEIIGEKLKFVITIPFNAQAQIILPDAVLSDVTCNGRSLAERPDSSPDSYADADINITVDTCLDAEQSGTSVTFCVKSGTYEIEYIPSTPYVRFYSLERNLGELISNKQTHAIIESELPVLMGMADSPMAAMGAVNEILQMPFIKVDPDQVAKAAQLLNRIRIMPDVIPPMIDWN